MVVTAALAACDGGTAGAPRAPAADAAAPSADTAAPMSGAGTPEVPPMGQAALEAWLAAGHYQDWSCEAAISPKRLNGAHGRHRICTNRILLDSASGPYPVGAASVKELFEANDQPAGFAVGLKVVEGFGADTWYWYERTGLSPTSRPVADKIAEKTCGPDCHAAAPRDNVFIKAPR